MKPENHQISKIRESFGNLQSRADFLNLLNEVKSLIYGEKAKPFELSQLTWYGNPTLGGNRYQEFKIKKKSGGERLIHAPKAGLKSLQRCTALILQCVYKPHSSAHGFVWGKSIVQNANLHVGNRYVFNTDLMDFFPSISQRRVWKCLQLTPFNLNRVKSTNTKAFAGQFPFLENKKGFVRFEIKDSFLIGRKSQKAFEDNRQGIANLVAGISCIQEESDSGEEGVKGGVISRLPQGAPTSPVLSNIVCQKLDFLLTGVSKRFGLKYSRYADDITFSSMHNVYQPESDFLKELHRIIAEQGFHIKESKTRLQKDGYRKEVTGLLVNEKVNVQQRYIKQLRMWLYYWERYGHERASGFFIQQYVADKGHVKNGKPDMANVISGKLDFLKMVKGADNELYLKLKDRFDLLLKIEDPILKILNTWESEGIDKALEVFNLLDK